VLLSGGIDSATCLYHARAEGFGLRAVTFAFYRMGVGEIRAARAIAKAAGVQEHRLVNVPELKEIGDIPGLKLSGLPPTYIPQRNSIFYSLAASYAEEVGADFIIGGHNREDQLVFDDTKDQYFKSLQDAFWAASRVLRARGTTILRPLSSRTKVEVIRYASSLNVPLELTWSCHGEGTAPCWSCEGCQSRRRNFVLAGIEDPAAPESLQSPRGRRKS